MRKLIFVAVMAFCAVLNANAITASDSAIVQILEKKGITFTRNNSITLLATGHDKFVDMFSAIRQAKSSVHLEYFNFRNDSIASELFEILKQKAAEGVEVRALFDGFGNSSNNRPLKKRHIESLRQAGVNIHEFDPVRFPWVNHVFSRDHRKIVVIDGNIAYTGGMNVADYYIKGTEQVGEWHDMHCRIEGGAVSQLQMIFVRIWNRVTGEDLWKPKYFRAYEPVEIRELSPDTTPTAHHKTVGIINREPHTSPDIIRTFYIGAINSAEDSIKLINPYFTLNRKIKRAIRQAIKRGVKFEILVSAKSDIPLTPDCVMYNVHKLMKHGANVWIYQPGFHHTKIMMVDGKYCTVGSANLNSRSLSWDYEANAVIIDKCTTRQLDNIFERDKKNSVRLTPEYWKENRSPWKKFVGWFAHLLSPFL